MYDVEEMIMCRVTKIEQSIIYFQEGIPKCGRALLDDPLIDIWNLQ